MMISRVKVRRVGPGEDAARWAVALADAAWHATATLLKSDTDAWVRRAIINGRDAVIKCRAISRADDRLKLLLGAARGDRQWRGATWLASHGFATAQPFTLATAEVDGMLTELLVAEYINARSVLEHLASSDLTVREQHEVCRALARLLAGMIKQGRYNRDGKPSNLLVVRSSGAIDVATIDTVAIRQSPSAHSKLIDMLASLMIEPIGVGAAPRLALRARVVKEVVELLNRDPSRRHVERLELWWHVSERVAHHGDPRPRVNPLSSASTS